MKHADIMMATAELIIAAGFKMKEQARQEMAEEDLGGGMFDQDVKEMRTAVASYALPQVYDAEEQRTLDAEFVVHETPAKSLKRYKTGTKLYFACVRPADSFDEGDGTMLGRLMFLLLHPHRRNQDTLTEKILDMIRSTNVLRSAQAKYRFLDEFIYHIVRNKMKLGASQTSFVVKTHLVALTANEAGRIARSFPMVMMANTTAAAAVDEFIMTYQALGEIDREYVWFRPMLTAIATELVSAVVWGVKFRAYLGAVVSAADALSDAYMIKTFYDMGDTANAKGLLAMVGANLAIQGVIVYAQVQGLKKSKWRTALFEMLTVVSFTKPGIDAYRVASGAEQRPGAALSPLLEMIVTKAGELFFEAIPG
ncbi:hypothetical protein TeGR_g635 [Tetraparma gracilis]|uniref:Uncharacterized protein n=1 Tax=Tetraparma gracilis TaxID=2962635 RepID=A0ABQ6MJX1_9STRA|nr:hypothetical protein TeGR_g635 [Tetraparma gracilis]